MELLNITINIHYTDIIFIICITTLISNKLIKFIVGSFQEKRYKTAILESIIIAAYIIVNFFCFTTTCASYVKEYKIIDKSKAVEFMKDNDNCQIIEKDNELYLIEKSLLNKDFTFIVNE